MQDPPASAEAPASGKGGPAWRERMKQRQKFWSLSHGFQFGRKLGDWGQGERRGKAPRTAEGEAEDAELQEAIRRSLRPMGGAHSLLALCAAEECLQCSVALVLLCCCICLH